MNVFQIVDHAPLPTGAINCASFENNPLIDSKVHRSTVILTFTIG